MKNTQIKILVLLLLNFVTISLSAQTDREILMRLDAKIEGMQKQMDVRFDAADKKNDIRFEAMQKQFEAMQKQMDVRFEAADKKNDIMLYVMIAMLAGIFGLIGFVIWDRQVSLKPIEDKNKEIANDLLKIKETGQKHENILKKIGEIEPRFGDILRSAGIF